MCDYYKTARHAARTAWHKLGNPLWTEQDWEDLIQDAVLETLKARPVAAANYPGDTDAQNAFIFGAAKRGAIKGWLRGIMGRNPATTIPLDFVDYVDFEQPDASSASGLNDQTKTELLTILCADKKQRTGRALDACKRDVEIVDLLVRGCYTECIANELGVAAGTVKAYRRQIKARLVAEANRRGIDSERVTAARKRSYGFVSRSVRSRKSAA